MAKGPIVQKNIARDAQIREQGIVDERKGKGKRKVASSKKEVKESKK